MVDLDDDVKMRPDTRVLVGLDEPADEELYCEARR
jgi:hypothetical protein